MPLEPLDDAELIARVLCGDSKAEEALVRAYTRVIKRVAYAFRHQLHGEFEDVISDVWEKLCKDSWHALRGLRDPSSLAAYVAKTARHACIDRCDSISSRPGLEPLTRTRTRDDDEIEEEIFAAPNTAGRINELRRQLLQAIRRVGPPHEQVLTLVYLEGASYAEAADQLRISEVNVGVKLHNARIVLRRSVMAEMPELRSYLSTHDADM